MYKLMIVDDDDLIRERIRMTLPLDDLGISLCAEAADGETALELFSQHHPQIVIVDINIPLINGLDFAKKIMEEGSNTGVIIITGYGTLDFAREAIHLGTTDFLLKPIDFEEMEAALRRIIRRLDSEYASYREQRVTEQLLRESLPLLRERYLGGILAGAVHENESECRSQTERLGAALTGEWLCCAVMIPNYSEIDVYNREALQIALENITTEIVRDAGIQCTLFYDTLSRAILIAGSNEKSLGTRLENCISMAHDKLRYYFQYDFSAGIGQEVTEILKLPESFHGAERALGYKNIFGENNIVNIKNVICTEALRTTTMRVEREKIMELFINANSEGTRGMLQQYFSRVITASNGSVSFMHQMYIELLATLLSCAREAGIDTETVLKIDPYVEILLANGPFQVQKQMELLCTVLIEQLRQKRDNRSCRLIEQAKRYVAGHLSDPKLNLSTVSENVGLSTVYFSSLFKKEIGCNFTDYLNRIRIERAKTLLATTNLRVYEVSNAVGYLSPKYFFQVFKRLTGKRPREFSENRELKTDEEGK